MQNHCTALQTTSSLHSEPDSMQNSQCWWVGWPRREEWGGGGSYWFEFSLPVPPLNPSVSALFHNVLPSLVRNTNPFHGGIDPINWQRVRERGQVTSKSPPCAWRSRSHGHHKGWFNVEKITSKYQSFLKLRLKKTNRNVSGEQHQREALPTRTLALQQSPAFPLTKVVRLLALKIEPKINTFPNIVLKSE